MPNPPRIELANGVIDGTNVTFTTSLAYLSNVDDGPQVFLNGQLLDPAQFSLTPPQTVALADAPRPGDVVQVYYQPS